MYSSGSPVVARQFLHRVRSGWKVTGGPPAPASAASAFTAAISSARRGRSMLPQVHLAQAGVRHAQFARVARVVRRRHLVGDKAQVAEVDAVGPQRRDRPQAGAQVGEVQVGDRGWRCAPRRRRPARARAAFSFSTPVVEPGEGTLAPANRVVDFGGPVDGDGDLVHADFDQRLGALRQQEAVGGDAAKEAALDDLAAEVEDLARGSAAR